MSRVTRTAHWTVSASPEALDAVVNQIAKQHGLRVQRSGDTTTLIGGSQAKMRWKGAWSSRDADLPKRGQVSRRPAKPGLEVALFVEETMGFGLMDRWTRSKYERALDGIVTDLDEQMRKLVPAPATSELAAKDDQVSRDSPELSPRTDEDVRVAQRRGRIVDA
jgi:hypothetical protein